jgi:2-pyrone-4,6-dicarboxylate lactonase
MRCDSHVHIVGPLDRYPQVAERTYQADIATLKQLENVSATRAVRRFVIVQPSFYGVDNFGRLDCACNNAGIEGKIVPLAEQAEEDFDKVMS